MTDGNPTVVVTSDESLPGIVERIREAGHGGRTVELVVPVDGALLLTAREFRALKVAIDEERLAVVLRTADPLRLQLAERLGLPAQALPRPRVTVAPAAAVPAIAVVPAAEDLAAPANDAAWPGETTVAAPVARADPESHWPDQIASSLSAATADSGAEETAAEAALLAANPPRRWLPVAAALVTLVAVTFLIIRFVVPRAVVAIVPRTTPVAATLLFDVTDDGKPLDAAAAFALMPRQERIEVVWEGEAPVTGVRVVPDDAATAPVELRNPAAEPVVVDKGTVVATETGVEFAFTEAVTVPAADPVTGDPGAATGRVQAVQPGSGGNVSTGEIGGRLPNGVYYSNRMEPAAGGTDQEFPVVAEADLAALSALAKEAAPELVAAAIATAEPGAAVLPSTVVITAQGDEFDHQAGDEAERLALRSTLAVDVRTYDGAAARAEMEPALASRLNDEAPDGFAIDPTEIDVQEPIEIETRDHGTRMEIAAEVEAAAVLDDSERAQLAAELAGASDDEAAAILADRPEVADVRVTYEPSWLPRQMPDNAGRIAFEIVE